jgi:hypothetical protein
MPYAPSGGNSNRRLRIRRSELLLINDLDEIWYE